VKRAQSAYLSQVSQESVHQADITPTFRQIEELMASTSAPAARLRYTQTAIALHWLIALLILCGFALGWLMTDIPGFTPMKLKYFSWHKWIGVTVFALALLRVLWRATHVPPRLPADMSVGQRCSESARMRCTRCSMC
jgi:hypothetical protein